MILIVLVLVAFLLLLYLHKMKVSRMDFLTAKIPGPKNYPLIGAALELGSSERDIQDNLSRLTKKYGHIFKGWLGPVFFVFLSSPDDVGDVLSSDNIDKSFLYKFMSAYVGQSLINLNGNTWRSRRKTINPSFNSKILEGFIDSFNANSKIFVENLKNEIGKSGFNVQPYIDLCTLDIILETAIGIEMNVQRDKNMELADLIHESENNFACRIIKPWTYLDIFFHLLPSGRKAKYGAKCFRDIVKKIVDLKITEVQKEMKNAPDQAEEDNDEGNGSAEGKKMKAFFDKLLNSSFPYQVINDEVATMLIAGQSTSASAVSFVLYALMKDQDIQRKVVYELDNIFQKSDRDPTMSDLKKMVYLEQVIKEALRMWPSAPNIARTLRQDVKLKSGPTLPAGCNVLISFYELHRNEEVYSNPDVFNPERFNKENSYGRSPYAFCPFSGGQRTCIGRTFAMLEMKVMLCHILRKYKILPHNGDFPDVELYCTIVINSKTGVYIRIMERDLVALTQHG